MINNKHISIIFATIAIFISFINVKYICANSLDDGHKSEIKNQAIDALTNYFNFEISKNYNSIYNQFSKNYKIKLKNNSNVRTADDYKRLRISSESKWYHFRIIEQSLDARKRVKFLVEATVQETGEEEQVTVAYFFVRERILWKIDEIDY